MPPIEDGGAFQNFDAPSLRFRVARIHPEKLAGEKRRLVAAGARADFDDHVFFVVGVLRNQQQLQLALDGFAPRFELRAPRHGPSASSRGRRSRTSSCLAPCSPFSISFHSRYFATISAISACAWRASGNGRIGKDFGRGKLLGHLLVARLDLVQLFKKRQISHVYPSVNRPC